VPVDVAAVGRKAVGAVVAVRLALAHRADGGEGLQAVALARGVARRIALAGRIVDDAVAGLDAAQRFALAVTDLHEAARAADRDVIGGGDGEPVPVHGLRHRDSPRSVNPM